MSRLIPPASSLLLALVAASASTAELTLDPGRSELVVRIFKTGAAAAFAHDHVIRASQVEGKVTWSPEQPAVGSIEVRSPTASLVVDEPELRRKYGLESELSDDTRSKVHDTMVSERQLDVAAYPEMSFVSRTVRPASDGSVEVTGDLTLHGTSKRVVFTVRPQANGTEVQAHAEITFNQSDFGIKPYRAMLGMVGNQDEAKLIVTLVAVPNSAPPQL